MPGAGSLTTALAGVPAVPAVPLCVLGMYPWARLLVVGVGMAASIDRVLFLNTRG